MSEAGHQPTKEVVETKDESQSGQAPELCRGMRFADADDLKLAVERFFASQGRGVEQGQGGSRQREFRCSGSKVKEGTREQIGCKAVIRATRQANREWRISSMEKSHENCTQDKHRVSVSRAGRIASEIVATTPNLTAKVLKMAIENRTGGTLSLRSAYRAKRAALAEAGVNSKKENHPSSLQLFLSSLAETPGTIVHYKEEDHTFRRCFLMLGQAVVVVTRSVPKVRRMDRRDFGHHHRHLVKGKEL